MSGSAFPTGFTGLTPARADTLLADNGTANGLISVGQILALLALTDIPAGGATNGQVLVWSGSAWAPGNGSSGGGITADQLAAAVNGLITTAQLTATVTGLVTPAELNAAVSGLVTTVQLAAALAGLGSGGSVSGETLDQETAAQAMSDTDAFPVAQPSIAGGALSTIWRGTLSQLWAYITGKMPGYHIPFIELTGNTILDGPTHNRRLLICTTSLSLSMPTTFGVLAGAGVAFEAEVQVESGAILTLPTTGATITGPLTIVGPAQARLRAWSSVVEGVNRFSCSTGTGTVAGASIALVAPEGVQPGTSYTVAGALSGYSVAPTLTISVDAAAFAALPTGSTVTASAVNLAMPGIASGSHTIQLKDGNGVLSNTITFSATAGESLTVTTPTAKTAGTAFTLSGGYTNGTPAALDTSIDGGTTWVAAASPTISGGTYSFSMTIASANASQTIKVRDHTNTGVIATTGAFAVAAASGGAPFAITSVTPAAIGVVGSPMVFNVAYTGTLAMPTVLVNGSPVTPASFADLGSGAGTFTLATAPAPFAYTVGGGAGNTISAAGTTGTAQTSLFATTPSATNAFTLHFFGVNTTASHPVNMSLGGTFISANVPSSPAGNYANDGQQAGSAASVVSFATALMPGLAVPPSGMVANGAGPGAFEQNTVQGNGNYNNYILVSTPGTYYWWFTVTLSNGQTYTSNWPGAAIVVS